MKCLFKISKKNCSNYNVIDLDIHQKLKSSLISKNIVKLSEFEKTLSDNLNTKKNSFVLSDCGTGKSLVSFIYILNKLLNKEEKVNVPVKLKESELFANTQKIYDENKKNMLKNREKKYLEPKGILYLSPKFEFLTNYYKKLRLIDPNNAFRFIRLGCSLQNITPIVEYIVFNI